MCGAHYPKLYRTRPLTCKRTRRIPSKRTKTFACGQRLDRQLLVLLLMLRARCRCNRCNNTVQRVRHHHHSCVPLTHTRTRTHIPIQLRKRNCARIFTPGRQRTRTRSARLSEICAAAHNESQNAYTLLHSTGAPHTCWTKNASCRYVTEPFLADVGTFKVQFRFRI